MIIQHIRYIIISFQGKIFFHSVDGDFTEFFNEVKMFETIDEATAEINNWDEEYQEKAQIVPIKLECSI